MTTADLTTDPASLPQYKGRPVPWVTRWSGELSEDRHKVKVGRRDDGTLFITYENGPENRDKFGVLWQREGIKQGDGEPIWKAVNTYRQRACMLKSKCQVCGSTITDQAVHWLMPLDKERRSTLQWIDDDRVTEPTPVTANAPTCAACVPLALDVCPNLKRQGYELYHVLDWGIWGVRGMHHYMADGSLRRKAALVPYNLTGLEHTAAYEGAVLAQQMVVVWNKFVLKESHDVAPEEGE